MVVREVSLRRDGLWVALTQPCVHAHPLGVYVHVYPEAEMRFNRARMHLDESKHLMDEEVTARVP